MTSKTHTDIKAALVTVSAKEVIGNPVFFEEVFGPSTLAVLAENMGEIFQFLDIMPGQLTGTVHAAEQEYDIARELIDRLSLKVGRVIMNGFPTGVEVSHSMVHGGPYPATTDSRVTSVGSTSIYRFTRPVCYQNLPFSIK